jgi:hypothetical protein
MCSKQEMEGEIMECFLCIDGAKKPAAKATADSVVVVQQRHVGATSLPDGVAPPKGICCIPQCKHRHIEAGKCSVDNCFMHIHPVCYHLFVIGKKKPIYDKDGNEMVVCAIKHHTLLSKAMNPTTTAAPDTPQQSQKKKSLDDPDTPQRTKQKKGNGAETFSNALIENGYNVWLRDGKNGPDDPNDSISLLIAWITKQENYNAYCIGVKAQICNRIADWLTKEMGVQTERTGKDVRNKIDTLKLQFKNAVTYMRGTGAGLEHMDP